MKKLFWIVAAALIAALTLYGEAAGLNVRDFGAKGDGIADDTAAIQAALYQAGNEGKNRLRDMVGLCPIGIPDQPPIIGVGETASVPEVFFPAGHYRLSKTVVIAGTAVLRGEPGTILEMTDPAQDIVYFHWAFRVRVDGIEFRGGNRQLMVCTCNNESARILIENCRFVGAAGAGIDCRSYLNPDGHDYATNPLPAYNVTWENGTPTLTPNDWNGKAAFNNSTLFVCRNSSFEDCRLALDVGADGATIADCEIVASASPALRLGVPYCGHARLTGVHATAKEAGGFWVENHTLNLAIRDSVFDGVPRSLIQQWNGGGSNVPVSVLLNNVEVNCAGGAEDAVVVVENVDAENTPRITEFFRVREASGHPVRALAWRTEPDRARLVAGRYIDQPALDAYHAKLVEWPYHISFGENQGLEESIPAALKDSVAAADIPDALRVKPPVMNWPTPVQHLKATDFGVDLDDATDDTKAMQRALDAAGAVEGMTVLELPTARIRIADSLRLPPQVALTAAGRAWIMQTTPERPIFTGENIARLKVERMTFSGGVDAKTECGPGFDLKVVPDAELEWTDCGFYSMNHTGIIVRGGKDNQVKLRIADSTFMTVRSVLDSDAADAEVADIWISCHGRMDEEAVIVNRPGGAMRIANILTVPGIMKYHYPPHLPYVKDWPNSDNLRWVDNYGRLEMLDNRIGGEWMGFCLVYNCDPRATLYLDGGLSCFFSDWSRKNILYCEYPPAKAVIRNVGWMMHFPDSAVVGAPDFLPEPEVKLDNIVY